MEQPKLLTVTQLATKPIMFDLKDFWHIPKRKLILRPSGLVIELTYQNQYEDQLLLRKSDAF